MKIALSTLAAVAAIAIAAPASAQSCAALNTTAVGAGVIVVPPSQSYSPAMTVATSGITNLCYTFTLGSAVTLTSATFTSATPPNPFTFTGVVLQSITGGPTYTTTSTGTASATLASLLGQTLTAGSYQFRVTGTSTASSTNLANIGSNIAFAAAAVPEAGTWAMMIAGFGLVGGAMRRRSTKVAFA